MEPTDFNQFNRDGFQIVPTVISPAECDRLLDELTPWLQPQLAAAKGKIGGVRNLLHKSKCVRQFAKSSLILPLLQQAAGGEVFPVRAIFFDKTPDANWLVPWHQDLAIAVARRIETPGFCGWSVKDGVAHVHPPERILAGMITLRVHLDDCDARNGALKVLAGSHGAGKISRSEISRWTAAREPVICEVGKGGALLMRPLVLHASAPAERPQHRRVLHIEYATQPLPNGLEWRDN